MRHFYQTRSSADRMGNAPHVHGKLQPMTAEDRAFWRFWRERKQKESAHG